MTAIFMSACSRVLSLPYSSDPGGNRNWRYRVVDVRVQVLGQPSLLSAIQESLEGALSALTSLQFGPLQSDHPTMSHSAFTPTQPTRASISVPSTTHSLSSYLCTFVSTCRSTSSSISSSLVCPSFLGKPVSPVVSTSHSVPCTTASTSAYTTSVVDKLFCPWNLPHISTPSTNSLSSLSPSSHFTDGPFSPCTLSSQCTPSVCASTCTSTSSLSSLVDELFSPWMLRSQSTPSTSTSTSLSSSLSPSSPSFLDELFE